MLLPKRSMIIRRFLIWAVNQRWFCMPITPKTNFGFVIPSAKIVDSADLAIHYQTTDLRTNGELELSVSLNDVEVTTLPVKKSSGSSELAHVSFPRTCWSMTTSCHSSCGANA